MFKQVGLALGATLMAAAAASAETPLERGRYLMNSIVACGNCHTPKGPAAAGREFAGGTRMNLPLGIIHVPNITPDPETGIGKWTDVQLVAAIREGRRPDGSIIGPPMPMELYRDLSDEDVIALVAYMRSVTPIVNKVPRSEYKIALPESYGPPVVTVPPVSKQDKVAYGAYLAGPAGHCIECHSTPGPAGAPDMVNMLGAGGLEFHGPWGVSIARNITPTNLGDWSDTDIKKAITDGVRPDGSKLMPPMGYPYYKNISEFDLSAIVAYLRTLPPK